MRDAAGAHAHVERYADPLLGWEKNLSSVKVEDVPGGHVSLLNRAPMCERWPNEFRPTSWA